MSPQIVTDGAKLYIVLSVNPYEIINDKSIWSILESTKKTIINESPYGKTEYRMRN